MSLIPLPPDRLLCAGTVPPSTPTAVCGGSQAGRGPAGYRPGRAEASRRHAGASWSRLAADGSPARRETAVRFCVIGAGSMGSLYGGLLARAGFDVTLLDVWAEHIEAIRRDGLRLDGITGDVRVRLRATVRADGGAARRRRPDAHGRQHDRPPPGLGPAGFSKRTGSRSRSRTASATSRRSPRRSGRTGWRPGSRITAPRSGALAR